MISILQWHHNGHDGVSNHQRLDCLNTCLFSHRSKETPKLRVTGLCEGNSPVTGDFLARKSSNAENVSIGWRHHGYGVRGNATWMRRNTTKSGSLFTEQMDVLPQDLVKSQNLNIRAQTFPIALKFDRHINNRAVEMPVKLPVKIQSLKRSNLRFRDFTRSCDKTSVRCHTSRYSADYKVTHDHFSVSLIILSNMFSLIRNYSKWHKRSRKVLRHTKFEIH